MMKNETTAIQVGKDQGREEVVAALENLTVKGLAKILKLPEDQISLDFENEAPTNPDKSINLFHYTAWLIQEQGNRN